MNFAIIHPRKFVVCNMAKNCRMSFINISRNFGKATAQSLSVLKIGVMSLLPCAVVIAPEHPVDQQAIVFSCYFPNRDEIHQYVTDYMQQFDTQRSVAISFLHSRD